MRAQSRHPLDPLSSAEISVAVATVRAAGATPEVDLVSLEYLDVCILPSASSFFHLRIYFSCSTCVLG